MALQIQVVHASTSREINAAFATFAGASGPTPSLSAPIPSSPAAVFRLIQLAALPHGPDDLLEP